MRWWRLALFVLGCSSTIAAAASPLASPLSLPVPFAAENSRQTSVISDGWRFSKGSPERAADPALDDSAWQVVRVPHDWAISEPFNPKNDSNTRFDWRGEAWYRHTLDLAAADEGKQVYLDFDGAMAFPAVYINGQYAGGWDYGYNSFRIDATKFVRFGERNVIAVHTDTRNHWSRWYAGAGLYRKVSLTLAAPLHIAQWGTYVTTPQVSAASAEVQMQTTVENHGTVAAPVTISTYLFSPSGTSRAAYLVAESTVQLEAGAAQTVPQRFTVAKPSLWSPKNPAQYIAYSTVTSAGKIVDLYETRFGIRTLVFTADDGLHVNGERVQIHGVDLHHDHGPLGAAFHVRAMERQLQIMKDMGVNAIRTSHNPAAPELLDLADKMGLLVFAECFDKWDQTADRLPGTDLAAFGQRQISQFIRRDRNHPSIMIWSIGNEIWEIEGSRDRSAAGQVHMMADFVRAFDLTRPVTMANHMYQALDTGLHHYLDVISWNYGEKYVAGKAAYPNKPTMMSESSSGVSTRGYYQLERPAYKEQFPLTPALDAADLNAVSWGDIPDTEFARIAAHPYVAGEFVWSGFDYIGEPTPYENVARSSYFGIVDLVGLPKDRFYLYRSYWAPEAETVHILPHWSWPESVIGKPVPVYVYTNGDSAELFLNGRSLGRQSKVPQAELPPNLALKTSATASSEQLTQGHSAKDAVDGSGNSRWCAVDEQPGAWLQIDLGKVRALQTVYLDFEQALGNYQYHLLGSLDGQQWTTLAAKSDYSGAGHTATLAVSASSRYLRLVFDRLKPGVWASLNEIEAYTAPIDRSYYGVTKAYRLLWDSVPYAPGELTAVAYRGGVQLGTASVRTAEAPAALELSVDRADIKGDGDDLSYATVRAVDSHGTLNPHADSLVQLQLDGPGELAGVGSGDPVSTDPFQASSVRLFHGLAVVIIKGRPGPAGVLKLTASAPGLTPAVATVVAQAAAAQTH